MKKEEQLIAWLNDAYAMECNLARVLDDHARDEANIPELRVRHEKHADETRRHASLVEECLRLLGEEPSFARTAVEMAMGSVQRATSGMFGDELVKNMLIDYSSEHLEIAWYTALIAAAEELGHARIAEICKEILTEEKAMATWLAETIPAVAKGFIRGT